MERLNQKDFCSMAAMLHLMEKNTDVNLQVQNGLKRDVLVD